MMYKKLFISSDVHLFFLVNRHQREILTQRAHSTLRHGTDCPNNMLSLRVWPRLLLIWLSNTKESVQSCNTRSAEFLKLLGLRLLLFFRFINVSVTLDITPTAFNIQTYIFWFLQSLDLLLDWSISLQISVAFFHVQLI